MTYVVLKLALSTDVGDWISTSQVIDGARVPMINISDKYNPGSPCTIQRLVRNHGVKPIGCRPTHDRKLRFRYCLTAGEFQDSIWPPVDKNREFGPPPSASVA